MYRLKYFEEVRKMKKAFDAIVVMTTLAIFGTVITFLATQSTIAALILIWSPVIVGGSYAIGEAHGKQKKTSSRRQARD